MFNNAITVTVAGVDKVLTRINQDGYSSEYLLKEAGGEIRLRIRNNSYKSNASGKLVARHNVEIVQTLYPASGSLSTANTVRKAYVVFEDEQGDDLELVSDIVEGLRAFLAEASVLKILNWES